MAALSLPEQTGAGPRRSGRDLLSRLPLFFPPPSFTLIYGKVRMLAKLGSIPKRSSPFPAATMAKSIYFDLYFLLF